MVTRKEPELLWAVEVAQDCPDDLMVISNDPSKYVAIRIEPYNPLSPVMGATRAYAQLICDLLNSGVNDENWKPTKIKKSKVVFEKNQP
jgi:hypothetical protein